MPTREREKRTAGLAGAGGRTRAVTLRDDATGALILYQFTS